MWFLGWSVLARFGHEGSIALLTETKYWAVVSAEESDSDYFLMLLSLAVGFRGTVAVLNGQILSDSLEDTNNCLDL